MKGLWFPAFQWVLENAHSRLSVYAYVNRWVKGDRVGAPPAVSDGLQLLWVALGALWLTLIRTPTADTSFAEWMRYVGVSIALYHLTINILVFALHWTFVANGTLENFRRSLAGFFVNLFEVALFSTIVLILLGCACEGPKAGTYSASN
jgi:hypothetical protein